MVPMDLMALIDAFVVMAVLTLVKVMASLTILTSLKGMRE